MAFLLFGGLPTGLQAQFAFVTNNGAITITAYTGTDKAVTIPGTTNGLPVTGIGVHAFRVCTNMTCVTIPASVTDFGWPAFQNCTNLLAVYFQGNAPRDAYPAAPPIFGGDPNATLYYLQGTTGWGSALDTLPVVKWDPQVLTQLLYITNGHAICITGYAGPGGALVIPGTINGLRTGSIGSNAWFNTTSLTGITLPNTVTNLGDSAFAGCTMLASIAIPNGAAGSGVFSNCTSLTNITFSPAATGIGASEFSGCTALTTVTVPGGITSIADWAFQNCSNLTSVYFQGNAPVADATVFAGANHVTNYYLPRTAGWGETFAGRPAVPVLFTYTASSSAITVTKYIGIWGSVAVPDTIGGLPVTAIGNVTFYGCASLTNIWIGTNVTSIAGQAFVGCPNLLAINVDANNPVYGSRDGVLFNQSQTALLYYPGGRAGSYTIPDGVTTLPNYAFQSCPALTSLTVPGSVTSIATLAFNLDPGLVTIYFLGNAPDVAWDAFDIQNTVTVVYLPRTTGWDTNLGGLPTVLWNPEAARDGSFGVRTNRFGFNITGNDGLVVKVDACTNLARPVWIPLGTNTLTGGSSYFGDSAWTNYPQRFYRFKLP